MRSNSVPQFGMAMHVLVRGTGPKAKREVTRTPDAPGGKITDADRQAATRARQEQTRSRGPVGYSAFVARAGLWPLLLRKLARTLSPNATWGRQEIFARDILGRASGNRLGRRVHAVVKEDVVTAPKHTTSHESSGPVRPIEPAVSE